MGATVTVGCKMPNGLILRIFDMVKENQPIMGGGFREVSVAKAVGPTYTVRGYSAPEGRSPKATVIGGYALTAGIDADFWERWLAENKDADYVTNRLIFAHEKVTDTKAEARDNKDTWDGRHRMVPDTDPRIPRKRNRKGKLVSAIETAEVDGDDAAMDDE
jgi:hypothetical protein